MTDTVLIEQLERSIRALTKRVTAPTVRALRSMYPGMDRGSFAVLASLEEAGDVRASDLAVIVELDLSTVSRHVSNFEQLGLVTRQPDPDDRRASRISLTEQGRTALARIRAARVERLDAVFASWSPADRVQLQRLLDQLVTDLCPPNRSTSPKSTENMERTA